MFKLNKYIVVGVVNLLIASGTNANFLGKVVAVTDGDTIVVLVDNKKIQKVRLANIDAPEKKQPYGTKSRHFLGNVVFNKNVSVKKQGRDKYGRVIGVVFLNELNVNKVMVKNGYAWAYKRYLTDNEYLILEKIAKDKKYGLWGDNAPIEPEKWRKQNTTV